MINVSESNRNILVSELRFVVEQIHLAQTPADKMYFFSAASGMIQRVLNIEYDPELLFAHQILILAQNQINGRVAQPNLPPHTASAITIDVLIGMLESAIDGLASNLEQGEEITDLLHRIATISYAATGNGQYLFIKGLLSL